MSSPDRQSDYAKASQQLQKKKRVGKACDSCRLKKTKCSGKQPCEKCQADNKICIYTERKKSRDKVYSYDYVELIEKRLRLVNRSLIRLSEMVKLGQNAELAEFASNLTYNGNDEATPISINQAIALLTDRHDVLDHEVDELGSPKMGDSPPSSEGGSGGPHFNNTTNNGTAPPHGIARQSSSNSGAEMSSSTPHGDSTSSESVSLPKRRSQKMRKDGTSSSAPSLSTNYNVLFSSPESMTPKSDDQFSPLQHITTNDTNPDFTQAQFGGMAAAAAAAAAAEAAAEAAASRLDDIKEEEKDDNEEIFSPMSPLATSLFLEVQEDSPIQPTPPCGVIGGGFAQPEFAPSSLASASEEVSNLGFSSLDLGPFQSGAQLATAAMNGFFSNSHSSNSGLSMSDFDLNTSNTNLNSPSSLVATSPDFKTMMVNPNLMSKNDNSACSPYMFGEDSYLDFNSVNPPSNLQRSLSTRSDGSQRKHTHSHGHHHSHSYSQHPHPYRTNSLSRVKSNPSIESALNSPILN